MAPEDAFNYGLTTGIESGTQHHWTLAGASKAGPILRPLYFTRCRAYIAKRSLWLDIKRIIRAVGGAFYRDRLLITWYQTVQKRYQVHFLWNSWQKSNA
jgi:hypothetical protein